MKKKFVLQEYIVKSRRRVVADQIQAQDLPLQPRPSRRQPDEDLPRGQPWSEGVMDGLAVRGG